MISKEVASLKDYLVEVDFLQELIAHTVLFRGQNWQGNLLPSIARRNPKENTTDKERKILQQLDLMGSSLLPSSGDDSLETMVVAQHFGLKTRLLDWTSNPLVALWFACEKLDSKDAYVYALEADKFLHESVYDKSPFSYRATKAFQPRLNNQRITAQHGWFTLHIFSEQSGGYVPLERNKVSKKYLYEYVIKSNSKVDIINTLERYGVSRRTLFPDLEGLCQFLNWKHDL